MSQTVLSSTARSVVLELLVGHLKRLGGEKLPRWSSLRLVTSARGADDVAALTERLRTESGPDRWYLVRTSAARDAVALRNGKTKEATPAGVRPDTPVVYVVLWTPDAPGHEANERSLIDLRAVEVADILRDPASLPAALEQKNLARCSEAVATWDRRSREAGVRRLSDLWTSLVEILRELRGGREGSVPFVQTLEKYGAFLEQATLDDEAWLKIGQEARPAALTRRWGEALAALDMFQVPALSSVTGVRTEPGPSPKGDVARALHRILSENLDAAIDHEELSSRIAGKQTLEQRVRELNPNQRLSSDPGREQAARADLLRFCCDRDPAAFKSVEWLFHSDPQDRGSASLGLKGLLIARGTGRPRRDPADVALDKTRAALPALEDAQRAAVDRHLTEQRAAVATAGIPHRTATLLRSLASGRVPTDMGELPQAYESVAAAGAEATAGLAKAADLWERLAGSEVPVVHAPSLLLGLARVVTRADLELPKPLTLWVEGVPAEPHVIVLRADGGVDLEALRAWLRGRTPKLVPARISRTEDEDDLEDATEELEEIVFLVGAKPNDGPVARIEVPLTVRALMSAAAQHPDHGLWRWRVRPDRWPAGKTATAVGRLAMTPSADGPPPLERDQINAPKLLKDAWSAFSQDLGTTNADALVTLLGPLPASARPFVEAWRSELERVGGAAAAQELKDLQDKLVAVSDDPDRASELPAIAKAIKALRGSAVGEPLKKEDVRQALQAHVVSVADAWDAAPERVVLTALHPLVVRARAVAEEALGRTTGSFLAATPPSDSIRRSVSRTLDRWGLPAPCHVYGWWDGEPLVFGEWSETLAPFGRFQAATAADEASLGVGRVLRSIERYARLQPASRDGLKLRVHGDAGGFWATELLLELCKVAQPGEADRSMIELIVAGTPQDALDETLARDEKARAAFEVGDDGAAPAVLIRRVEPDATSEAHVGLVLGPTITALRPRLDRQPVGDRPSVDTWDSRTLFARPRSRLDADALVVGLPEDTLTRAVARAIAFAGSGSADVWVERLSFDRANIRKDLERLHTGVHWLVTISRHPVHRAFQQVGEVARLLDVQASHDGGRPIHVCASVGAGRFDHDLRLLGALTRRLVGAEAPAPERIVDVARRFAPGLAMACTGTPNLTHLEGLLGLLLTRGELLREDPKNTFVLALDSHLELLAARSRGTHGDALILRLSDELVSIRVAECKFTGGSFAVGDPVIDRAREQVRETCRGLDHFTAQHALSAADRNALIRAVEHQADLADDEVGRRLVTALDRGAGIQLDPATAGVVHAWALSGPSADVAAVAGGPRVVVHGSDATRAALRGL